MSHEPKDHLVLTHVRQYMERRGIDRRALGERVAAGGNLTKALRRVDRLLRSGGSRSAFLERVVAVLEIPPSELEVALEVQEEIDLVRSCEADQRRIEMTMERRGPHLWGRLPENYNPGLMSIVGPEFWLMVRVPHDLLELPDYEQLQEVGRIVRDHYQNHRRCRLDDYDYRRCLNEVFSFGPDGNFLRALWLRSSGWNSYIRIKGRKADTTAGLFSLAPEEDEG